MSLVTLALVGLALGAPDPRSAWAEFSRHPALRREAEKVEVGTLGREEGRLQYWLRRTVTEAGRETVTWTDSRHCPIVRSMLSGMRDIAMPRPAPYGFDGDGEITLDGVGYMLRAPVRFGAIEGEMTIRSNVETPLARWVEASLSSLAPCWTHAPPE